MTIKFKKIIIKTKPELKKHKSEILKLFKLSYDRAMDEELWEWAYIKNPNGDPIVSLYFDEGKLVGHYAVIPISLSKEGDSIKALLSMTTMVHPDYRKMGIFVSQATDVYKEAEKDEYMLVCGFPNHNSAHGFRAKLGWTIIENLCVSSLTPLEIDSLPLETDKNSVVFNVADQKALEWRLAKPQVDYIINNGNILKKFNSCFDVVYRSDRPINHINNVTYNLIVEEVEGQTTGEKKFEYLFGYRLFNEDLKNISFKMDLIISDLF